MKRSGRLGPGGRASSTANELDCASSRWTGESGAKRRERVGSVKASRPALQLFLFELLYSFPYLELLRRARVFSFKETVPLAQASPCVAR